MIALVLIPSVVHVATRWRGQMRYEETSSIGFSTALWETPADCQCHLRNDDSDAVDWQSRKCQLHLSSSIE